ncbi:probable thiol methyltransferase 2 isoform X1 [Asparagus officinalis]|uniref:probable thiol methyltransferase 2 isoform X1 n=1 Tax=Asparagus officinalis TaxID=4686 RepID=UPI00098DFA13|nr:probable thiol methyltransferase 2 isoform X1 [Asparagus officinalis]
MRFLVRPPLQHLIHHRLPPPLSRRVMSRNVDSRGSRDPSSNPKVAKIRQLLSQDSSTAAGVSKEKHEDSFKPFNWDLAERVRETLALIARKDGWEKCWEEGVTPWDLGQPTPVVLHLLQTGTLPKGRILVPGCGTGYDVVAMASPDRHVVGLDVSRNAVKKAKEWSSSFPNANYFDFVAADFFTWQPAELFDMVFDYTFFFAIDPCMRPSWAKKMADILKPDGELITLIYLINDQESGPPYNNSIADYEEVLNPVGFKALSIVDNDLAIAPRRGKEKLGRWKRCLNRSSL